MEKRGSALSPLTRQDAILACACLALGMSLYVLTIAPSLLYGDSAELQTLAYTLGLTHPTGYPIYILAARLFVALVPFGSVAYRVNLLSAAFASLALAFLYLLGRLLAGRRLACLAGAMALCLADLFWFNAIVAELYTAAAALVAFILFLIILWRQRGDPRLLFAAGLLGGLSLAVHSTVALLAPAVLVYLTLSARRRSDWLHAVSGAVTGVLLGLLSFLALDALDAPSSYFNSTVRPSLSVWNLGPSDFDSPLERLAFLGTARQFRVFMFTAPASTALEKLAAYSSGIGWNTYLLLTLGLANLFRRGWREALLVVLAWAGMMAFILNYDIWDFEVFFVPTLVPLTVVVASGYGLVLDALTWLARRLGALRRPDTVASIAGLGLLAVLFYPMVPSVIHSLHAGYPVFLEEWGEGYPYPFGNPALPHDYALAIVNRLEDEAIVFTDWDMLYPLYYVAHVEQRRTSIAFHETFPQDGVTELAESARTYIDTNLGRRPVYVTGNAGEFAEFYSLARVDGSPPLYRLSAQP